MPKKGNGYTPDQNIANAMQQCGCPEQRFQKCIETFGQTAESFANYVMTHSQVKVRERMKCPIRPA